MAGTNDLSKFLRCSIARLKSVVIMSLVAFGLALAPQSEGASGQPATATDTLANVQSSENSIPIWWSSKLGLSSISALDARMARPLDAPLNVRRYPSREDLLNDRNVETTTIANCVTYLDLTKKGFQAPKNQDWQYQLSLGAECNALDLLRTAKPARVTYLKTFRLNKSAVNFLPPRCGPVVSKENATKITAAEERGLSWKQYERITRIQVQKTGELEVEGDYWEVVLDLYARGDFNGDGVEDILLRKDDSLRGGSYATTSLLLLTRFKEGAVLKVLREILR